MKIGNVHEFEYLRHSCEGVFGSDSGAVHMLSVTENGTCWGKIPQSVQADVCKWNRTECLGDLTLFWTET